MPLSPAVRDVPSTGASLAGRCTGCRGDLAPSAAQSDGGAVDHLDDHVDLSALMLNATTQTVLSHLLRSGETSISGLASATSLAPSLVSRSVRLLEERGVVLRPMGRSTPVCLAPQVGRVLRAEAEVLRQESGRRAAAIEDLAAALESAAPPEVHETAAYWLVPLSADGPDREQQVRRVRRRFDACVPRGGRARGVPWRAVAGGRLAWRLLVSDVAQVPDFVPRTVDLEVRITSVDLPWLEVLDGVLCAFNATVDGRPRRVWCRVPQQSALAAAGFEWWWASADRVAL